MAAHVVRHFAQPATCVSRTGYRESRVPDCEAKCSSHFGTWPSLTGSTTLESLPPRMHHTERVARMWDVASRECVRTINEGALFHATRAELLAAAGLSVSPVGAQLSAFGDAIFLTPQNGGSAMRLGTLDTLIIICSDIKRICSDMPISELPISQPCEGQSVCLSQQSVMIAWACQIKGQIKSGHAAENDLRVRKGHPAMAFRQEGSNFKISTYVVRLVKILQERSARWILRKSMAQENLPTVRRRTALKDRIHRA
jgi:hypothetical protein